jgi:hypothetical protein
MERLPQSLGFKQMLLLVLAAVVIAGLTMFSRWNRERDFRRLYMAARPRFAAKISSTWTPTLAERIRRWRLFTVAVPAAGFSEARFG